VCRNVVFFATKELCKSTAQEWRKNPVERPQKPCDPWAADVTDPTDVVPVGTMTGRQPQQQVRGGGSGGSGLGGAMAREVAGEGKGKGSGRGKALDAKKGQGGGAQGGEGESQPITGSSKSQERRSNWSKSLGGGEFELGGLAPIAEEPGQEDVGRRKRKGVGERKEEAATGEEDAGEDNAAKATVSSPVAKRKRALDTFDEMAGDLGD
jgi:hypothetical protein